MGILFHDTAEIAAKRNLMSSEEWNNVCEELGHQESYSADIVDQAKDCVDRYFRTGGEFVGRSSMQNGRSRSTLMVIRLRGKIDVVCRNSAGNLVVLDYKATTVKRSLDDNLQLPIYLLACQQLFDERIDEAGYVYVGSVGPDMSTRSFSRDELDQCREDLPHTVTRG